MIERRIGILIEFVSDKNDEEIQRKINNILDMHFFDVEVKNFRVGKREVSRGPNAN